MEDNVMWFWGVQQMQEFLMSGVYVEEFDSGSKLMEDVGTSTAGIVGLSVKKPDKCTPLLVTNFAYFRRKYGGYLSQEGFGDYRFFAYAVEHFFHQQRHKSFYYASYAVRRKMRSESSKTERS